ncbi:MAG: carbamoyltransferase HypF [Gemmatimonadota bacterium]
MAPSPAATRLRLTVLGAVQGVGFRPFAYRLAHELGLAGWVQNTGQGVTAEVEGPPDQVDAFLLRLQRDLPPPAAILSLEPRYLDAAGLGPFEIRPSHTGGPPTALILPDIATCARCRAEIADPRDRRFRYPFTNCTHCGPRFSIIRALPYDRPHTTMQGFRMCARCRAEYEDPADRRFHAQPNACPDCGPRLAWWDAGGQERATGDPALRAAVAAIAAGAIVAVKGLGGFHLVVEARCEAALARLRLAKVREEKPFALMYPSLERVRQDAEVSDLEARLLLSPESPIVLLRRRDADGLAPSVAPGNPNLGIMLPYTPLHHLLLADLGEPVVATSGNLADEPLCVDEGEAVRRLGGMAEHYLVHDRPIARPVDDAIARVVAGRELVLRRARGYAPLPVALPFASRPAVATGAHLKSAAAVAVGDRAYVSQHVGDLETPEARACLRRAVADLCALYRITPEAVACDLHPDYASTRLARELAAAAGLEAEAVQHHSAHVWACLAENELEPPVLGVAWDGTGYGGDGTVWGGELLLARADGFCDRVASLRPFGLPGGEAAVREPRRAALGALYELYGDALFAMTDLEPVASLTPAEGPVLARMLAGRLNCPRTTSAGRLFDAMASLLGLRQRTRYEGQAAMELEHVVDRAAAAAPYDLPVVAGSGEGAPLRLDWGPMLEEMVGHVRRRAAVGEAARRFHDGLAAAIVAVARQVGLEPVALSGGCFQNAYLTEVTVAALRGAGFRPYWHQRVPPNDGGIALGQLAALAWHRHGMDPTAPPRPIPHSAEKDHVPGRTG